MPGPRKQSFAKPKNAKGTFRRILKYFKPYRAQLVLVLIGLLASVVFIVFDMVPNQHSISQSFLAFRINDIIPRLQQSISTIFYDFYLYLMFTLRQLIFPKYI